MADWLLCNVTKTKLEVEKSYESSNKTKNCVKKQLLHSIVCMIWQHRLLKFERLLSVPFSKLHIKYRVWFIRKEVVPPRSKLRFRQELATLLGFAIIGNAAFWCFTSGIKKPLNMVYELSGKNVSSSTKPNFFYKIATFD